MEGKKRRYSAIRRTIGSWWGKLDDVCVDIFTTDDQYEATKFIEDDIEDYKAKWPELGESEIHMFGTSTYWYVGKGNFEVQWWIRDNG